ELRDIKEKPIDGIFVEPENDNLFVWSCAVKAASDTPYKGGTFRFKLELPSNFPFKAPTVVFQTKIYHPGINEEGHICVPILRDEWKPSVTLSTVLAVIQEKVNNPSADDPFEPEIAAVRSFSDPALWSASIHCLLSQLLKTDKPSSWPRRRNTRRSEFSDSEISASF
ncbi:ubiquitin-conjugating enzyme/RWD-like protein, partial [Pisolithus albus]